MKKVEKKQVCTIGDKKLSKWSFNLDFFLLFHQCYMSDGHYNNLVTISHNQTEEVRGLGITRITRIMFSMKKQANRPIEKAESFKCNIIKENISYSGISTASKSFLFIDQ